ncbi:nucleotidyltransferase [Novipirellula rosea]|uniref:Adenylyl/Guanylyl and SMODS C-terminal sensor domain-containing protein n=1 Tax=Novipirellula rosea TaxID=1031540 RepID=A0ABP8M6B8_9BACT
MQMVMKEQLDDLLRAIADDLDIPDHLYEDAVLKYTDVGEWLAQEDSELAQYEPDIFPQGSFRLGTMVKPINDSDEYDIDLVCHLKIKKENTTQKELKERVGKRLEARADIKKILKPSRRCWILDYAEPFHMDVLPVIPNVDRLPNGILLTDTELRLWQYSNPIDYAEWFKEQMKVVFRAKRAAMAKSYQMSIEEVPEYEVKTPLQRVVQLLKRHRDIHFLDDYKNRPVSVIITTLAAHAYSNQADLFDALTDIVQNMPNFVERREDGKWWVENPVDPDENFADKWNEYPERREAFFGWLEQVHDDFVSASQKESMTKSASALSGPLGRNSVSRAASSLGYQPSSLMIKSVSSGISVPALADTSHCQPPVFREIINPQARVSVSGDVYRRINGRKKLWKLTSKPVPKGVALKFVASTNVRQPYEVRWQVVNTGAEARSVDGLRGGFDRLPFDSGDVRWEETGYAGTHWIEAFIIKDGICVARSKPIFVRVRG